MPIAMQFPFLDWLNEQPEVGYFSALQSAGLTPAMQRYFQGQQSSIYNDYLGALGQQAARGESPTLLWTDYLAQMPFTNRYARLPWAVRNPNYSSFSPATRWMV